MPFKLTGHVLILRERAVNEHCVGGNKAGSDEDDQGVHVSFSGWFFSDSHRASCAAFV
jgi:hypothetical protein